MSQRFIARLGRLRGPGFNSPLPGLSRPGRRTLPALLLAASLLGPAAFAQRPTDMPPAGDPVPAARIPPPQAVSDDTLRKYVRAFQKVDGVEASYASRLQAAQPGPERDRVQQEAEEKMKQAVHDEGLTVQEYAGVGQAVQEDPALKRRVREMSR